MDGLEEEGSVIWQMLMYAQKLKMSNKSGKRDKPKQTELLIRRVNLRRVRNSIKMVVKEEGKSEDFAVGQV